MDSPKSYHKPTRRHRPYKRKHTNKKFYNSTEWKNTRKAYLIHYKERLYSSISLGRYNGMELIGYQVSYLLSLDFLPCEICLKLYIAEAYDKVTEGVDMDHIIPINPDNAIESKDFGKPFEFNNLQLLCRRHHSRKTQREKK